MAWLAFHVFQSEPLEPLLLDCVAGLSRRLKRERLVDRFFFIRYAEEGNHVRLRFEVTAGERAVPVREDALSTLRRFLDSQDAAAVPIVEARYDPELAASTPNGSIAHGTTPAWRPAISPRPKSARSRRCPPPSRRGTSSRTGPSKKAVSRRAASA